MAETTNETVKLYFYRLGSKGNKAIEINLDIIPQNIKYSYSSSFASQALGKPSPAFLYTGGSDATYSFSIDIHEDMLPSGYNNIVEFVDKIKQLSYPAEREAKSQTYEESLRTVYFQIGSIAGKGSVNTSVTWQKPFRKGNYVMATIGFTIVVEHRFQKVEQKFRERLVAGTEVYQDVLSVEYFNQLALQTLGEEYFFDYNMDAVRSEIYEGLVKTYNYNLEKLINLKKAFEITDKSGLIVDALSVIPEDPSQRQVTTSTVATYSKAFKKLTRDKVEEYMNHYYKNINKDMLPEERDLIVETIMTLVNNLNEAAEAMYKYGASS
jgi:hypothetical protein